MENNTLNIAECIFFCFHSFAFLGDRKIEKEEIAANAYYLREWLSEGEELLMNTINKTLTWTSNELDNASQEEFTGTLLSIVDHLKNNLNTYQKEKFLMHIRLIAQADKDFHDDEKRLHDVFASIMELDVRVSQSSVQQLNQVENSIPRRPVGFRASWNQ
jgi:hypothetical protein